MYASTIRRESCCQSNNTLFSTALDTISFCPTALFKKNKNKTTLSFFLFLVIKCTRLYTEKNNIVFLRVIFYFLILWIFTNCRRRVCSCYVCMLFIAISLSTDERKKKHTRAAK